MPPEREFAQNIIRQIAQAEAWHEAFKIVPVQHVQPAKRDAARPHFLHPGLVFAPPGVRKRKPVEVVSTGSKDSFRLAGNRGAPVDKRPEHVKKQRPHDGHKCPCRASLEPQKDSDPATQIMAKSLIKWRERRDSNPRPLP